MASNLSLEAVAHAICAARGSQYISEAGEGAFKQTFRIREDGGTVLALKVYKAGYHSERSEREVRAMQTCEHPNIARLHTLSQFDTGSQQHLYTIEEFLGGGTLADRVRRDGLLDPTTVRALASALIGAVSHIASHQFVHRDLKPDNIMFREGTDIPVVVDFGLVRDLSAPSITADWIPRGPGTPYFAAPEQLNNEKDLIDWRTDQFSLGILLACVAFGRHPYGDSNPGLTVQAVAQRGPLTQEFEQGVQRTGLTGLTRMVAAWPVRRYRTQEELAAAWAG